MITMQVHINVQSENDLSVKAKKFAAHDGGDNELDGIFFNFTSSEKLCENFKQ